MIRLAKSHSIYLNNLIEACPQTIDLPKKNSLSGLSLPSLIKKISPYVVIIKVYDKVVCGLTVREIVARLSISQHTIQQCRMIAVNELACSYELAHLKVRKN